MKKFPKLFAALLACAMALTLLTACQDANGNVVVPGTPSSTPTEAPLSAEDQILTQINQLRAANGKPDVQRNADLDALAESLMDAAVAVSDTSDMAGWNQAITDRLSAQTIVVNDKVMNRSTMTFYPGYSNNGDYGFKADNPNADKIATNATTDVGIAVREINGLTYFIVVAARA